MTTLSMLIPLWRLATIAVLVVGTAKLGHSQPAATIPKAHGPLRLVISSSKDRLKLGESFVLSVRLINTGQEGVWLYGRLLWGAGGGLILHVVNQRGQTIHSAERDDDMVIPSSLFKSESYILLRPDHFLGVERPDKQKNLFPDVGSYSISVEYQTPVPKMYKKAANFWSRESGMIRSAPIHIEVIE